MLNEKKIRLMTKLAIYEEKEGREDLRLNKYYKTDYVRFQLLKTILCVTIGFALVLVLVGAYQSEYLIAEAVKLNYKAMGEKILSIYIITIVVYMVSAFFIYTIQYNRCRKRIGKYLKNLKKLREFYKNGEL